MKNRSMPESNLRSPKLAARDRDLHPVTQMARNAVDENAGAVRGCRYLLHDRDAKICVAFQDVFASEGIRCLRLPPRSPNLNAFAERWVRSVKEECLAHLILFGERSLHRAVTEFVSHFHSDATIKAKETPCSSLPRLSLRLAGTSAVEHASVACFDITVASLEYFYPTGNQPATATRWCPLRGFPHVIPKSLPTGPPIRVPLTLTAPGIFLVADGS
jgi:hypothetical protein